jgi:hypothetical protein
MGLALQFAGERARFGLPFLEQKFGQIIGGNHCGGV